MGEGEGCFKGIHGGFQKSRGRFQKYRGSLRETWVLSYSDSILTGKDKDLDGLWGKTEFGEIVRDEGPKKVRVELSRSPRELCKND